jgi:hypothetical protein
MRTLCTIKTMEFGVFNSFWDGHPNHLPFLNLRESKDDPKEWNLQTSIAKLYSILKSHSDGNINEGIRQLIKSDDWRPHIVASISILSFDSQRRNEFIDLLWERLSRGSWTSPQILVVLSIIDKDFISKASKIVSEGFAVNYSQLTPIEHHVSRGGTSIKEASAKVVAVIYFLLNKIMTDSVDSEQGASIAKNWTESLTKLIDEGKIRVGQF